MKIVSITKTVGVFLLCAILIGFVVFTLIFNENSFSKNLKIILTEIEKSIIQDQQCIFGGVEERIVRGNSLSGLIEPGERVKVLFGYYDCYKIEREDIILYSYPGSDIPFIKIVKGVPGDDFHLQTTESGWHIIINKEILRNSKGQPYFLNEKGYKMLSLYEKDYQGTIPEKAYLTMSNLPTGATDSTRYGLVHKNNILGKAEVVR